MASGCHPKAACLLAAAFVLLSGCSGGPRGDAEDAFASAMATQDAASAAARAWDASAQLVSVLGVEPNNPGASSDGDGDGFRHLAERRDPDVGDGHAQAWLHSFTGDEGGAYSVVVSASGEVLWEDPSGVGGPDGDGSGPVADWSVDSDEAAATVAERSPQWRNATARNDTVAFFILFQAEDPWDGDGTVPLWIVGVESEAGSDLFLAFVHARNGSYMDLPDDGGGTRLPPPAEGGGTAGRLTLAEPEEAYAFELESQGHEALALALRLGPGTGTVNVTVEGPGGVVWSRTVGEPPDASVAEFRVDNPMAGAWTATLRLETGVLQDFVFEWCAGGPPPVGGDGAMGCGPNG